MRAAKLTVIGLAVLLAMGCGEPVPTLLHAHASSVVDPAPGFLADGQPEPTPPVVSDQP